jgi:beta-lactamase class A
VLVSLLLGVLWTHTPSPPALESELTSLIHHSGSHVGVLVQHLERQETTVIDADETFPMASTFKLPLALVVLRLIERGELPSLDTRVRLEPTDMIPWASPLHQRLPVGGEVPLREVLASLLEESDNSAADFLLRRAGGPARVRRELEAMGLPGISIDRDEAQMALDTRGARLAPARRTAAKLDAILEQVPRARQRAALRRFRGDPRDRASPRAMGRLLQRLWLGDLLETPNAAFLRDELGRCRTGDRRMRAGVPAKTAVASRTGTCGGLDDQSLCANELGVITLPSGDHVIVVVFIEDAGSDVALKERLIAAISGRVWEHYLTPP